MKIIKKDDFRKDGRKDAFFVQYSIDGKEQVELELSKKAYDDLIARFNNAKKYIIKWVNESGKDQDYKKYWIDVLTQILENVMILYFVNGLTEREAMLEFISEYNEVRKLNDLPPQLDLEPFVNLN
jgi:hypothetical protein